LAVSNYGSGSHIYFFLAEEAGGIKYDWQLAGPLEGSEYSFWSFCNTSVCTGTLYCVLIAIFIAPGPGPLRKRQFNSSRKQGFKGGRGARVPENVHQMTEGSNVGGGGGTDGAERQDEGDAEEEEDEEEGEGEGVGDVEEEEGEEEVDLLTTMSEGEASNVVQNFFDV